MIKKYSLSLIAFSCAILSGFGQSDVIISQYIEDASGGSFYKGVEIFNVSGADIFFSGVNRLEVYKGTNGAACSTNINVSSGILKADEVWVIGTTDLKTYTDANGTSLSGSTAFGFSFNGDDALQLYLGGTLQDEFGVCGTDPGSSWTGGGVDTSNNNLQIKNAICDGDLDGWSNPSIRFDQIADGNTPTGFGNAPASCVSGPTITTSTSSLSGFTYEEGSGPSGEQNFTVSGSNLTNDISVTPPTNWEISLTSGGSFSPTNPIPLTHSGGTVASTTIYTRMISGLLNINNPFSESISCTSSGATTQNVAVDGTVTLACIAPTNQATALSFSNISTSSIDVSFTASSPAADNYLVVQSTNATLSSNPVDTNTYAVSDAIGGGTVVFNGSGTSFTDSGLMSNTTYYYFVFAYNNVSCSGGPLYNTPSLTDNATTLNGPCFTMFGRVFPNTSGFTINSGANAKRLASGSSAGSISTNQLPSVSGNVNVTFNAQGWDGNENEVTVTLNGVSQFFNNIADGSYNVYSAAFTSVPINSVLEFSTVSGKRVYIELVELYCSVPIPAPEMDLKQSATSYATTTVSAGSDTYNFGNQEISTNTDIVFTIENTGDADLTLSAPIVSGTGFSLQTGLSATNISGPSGTATFTVRFTPNALGNFSGTISIANNDADENPYVINITGTGTNSADSDIIEYATFTYTSNINYLSYQADPISATANSVGVFKFDIRDGGGASPDSDSNGTELTDITFNVGTTHINYIRNAALFNVGAMVNNTPTINVGAGTITFSGFSYTAPNNGIASLTLRVSFLTTVTDNEQLQFTVTSATANASGSVFATANAGGATSSTTGNRNRIEVIADRLSFSQQPSDTSANAAMSPNVQVSGADINSNIDLDWSGTINLTSTGTMTGDPLSQATVGSTGTSTFTNLIHTVAGTGLTLNATATGLTAATSTNFLITTFSFLAGDFRPLFGTDFSFNGDWEYFNGSAWGAVPDGNAPQNTSTTINRILIDESVTGGGSSSNNYDCDILILNGGTLELTDNDNPPIAAEFLSSGNTLEVQSGGELIIRGDIDLPASANLFVRDGATMIIDQNSMNNEHPLWDGIEKFEGGSMLEIRDWDWGASATQRSLVNVATAINNNDNGYKFGNVYFNPTLLTNTWTIIGSGLNINVTENDFEINNTSNFFVLGMSNKTANISSTYGGNILVSDGPFTFGGSFSTDTFDQSFLVRGNVIINNDDAFYVHHAFNGTPTIVSGSAPVIIEGNLEVWGLTSTVTSDVTTKEILFSGDNSHTIEVAPNCSNVPFIVESGDTVTLLNEDLKFTGDSGLEIETGATFDFSFNSGGTGTTALEVQNISGGNNTFVQNSGSYLFITHPQGIWDASTNGNVQSFSASNTTYSQPNSTYHYIGKANQETGDAFTTSSTSKTILVELLNNTDELTVTETTGTSTLLEIRSGIVVNAEASHINGPGDLTMSNGGLRTSVLGTTSTVPSIDGTYNLTGGFIQLNAASDQVLRGSRNYRDLFFSVSGAKTTTSAITSIIGTITTENAAILDTGIFQMGGGLVTDLTMNNTSQYRTAGTSTKPDAQGTYILNSNTKIVFTSNEASLENIRLDEAPYANIDVEGSGVGTNSLATGIRFQAGGTFTVKSTGTFKQSNTNGFSGVNGASLDNTLPPGTIILEVGSTVEYAGGNQTFTEYLPNYTNVNVSGTGTKTLGTIDGITVGEDLHVLSSLLQIDNDKYFEVIDNVTVDGNLTVEKQGAFVQRGNGASAGTFTNNGTSLVNKTTSDFSDNNLHYTYWSSPVTNADPFVLFPNADDNRRYYYEAANFLDIEVEVGNNNATTAGSDDIDDNGDDWREIVYLANPNLMSVGLGFAITATAPPTVPTPFPYNNNVSFSGAFNTGDLDVTIEYNGDNGDNDWNFIGNPYPGALSFSELFKKHGYVTAANATVEYPENLTGIIDGCAFLWSHASIPESTNNGNNVVNFNQDDYAMINLTGNTAGGSTVIPNSYIPSGQGFFVKGMNGGGTLTFDNSMRMADVTSNSQFFGANNETSENTDTLEPNKLWLSLHSDNNVFNQLLIGYVEGATNTYDGFSYDAPRNLSTTNPSNIYTMIDGDERPFAIQGKGISSLNLEEVIPLGFKTSINEVTIYRFSIPRLEGTFLNENVIYVKDNLLNSYHNLKESDYNFISEVGEFNDRFEIVFTLDPLSLGENELTANSLKIIEHTSGKVEFKVSDNLQIKTIEIIDITGKSIYNFNVTEGASTIYNLSALSQATYIARVGLVDGRIITRKAIKTK